MLCHYRKTSTWTKKDFQVCFFFLGLFSNLPKLTDDCGFLVYYCCDQTYIQFSGPRNWVVEVFPDRLQMTSADCFKLLKASSGKGDKSETQTTI